MMQTATITSTGDFDVDSALLEPGGSRETRPFFIPDDAPAGRYEFVAEIWPPNMIGEGETLTEDHCPGHYRVNVVTATAAS